ncbi:fungal-specific transcription factor domain-containing protein [Leptodontidium sp. 2 PMI_412]|nr:fungal-specific transcription factor domain-containing protein [Leptodontidium sp. 2 PMI_412]
MAEVHENANTPPGGQTIPMTKHKRLERSCVLCHQRKIRCDKKSPCRNCTRADVLCYYPEPEQSVRRAPKTTIADVSARLARLERTISALFNDPTTNQGVIPPAGRPVIENFNSLDISTPSVESAASEEKLVQGDASSRYYNEALISRVLEEEQEIRNLIENQPDTNHSHDSPFLDIDPLLSAFHKPTTESRSNHPARQCAIQLWQAFVNNVDPLFKIFHIPTTQSVIYGAISNSENVDAGTNALLFAVYFAGVTSLSSDQVMNLLGLPKNTALNTFKQGLEQSLAAADFLDTPNIIALQAITLFIANSSWFCFRGSNTGRAVWTLNGLVTRSAQSIGLHRDGTNFKLSHFECEMRRRLWWLIVANDFRVTEDHGLKIYTSDSAIDVALPSNVNDSELYPTMKGPPPASEPKWSDMSFSLMVIEAYNVLRKLSPPALPNSTPSTEAARQQTFDTLKAHFETVYLQHCDQNIPIQRMAYLVGKLLPSKLDFVTRQQWLRHHTSTTLVATPGSPAQSQTSDYWQGTETDLLHAIKILEISDYFRTDAMLQGFQWNIRTYPQYHVLMFVFRYLCVAPEGPMIDRAWVLANTCFENEASFEQGWNWTVLSRLRGKAMKIRESVSAARAGSKIYERGGGVSEKDIIESETPKQQSFDAETATATGATNYEGGGVRDGLLSSMDWSSDAFLYWGETTGIDDLENF